MSEGILTGEGVLLDARPASFATRLPKRFVIDSRRSTGAPAVSVTSTLHFAVGFGWLSSTFTV